MLSPTIILSAPTKKIKYVIHVSDIHIRTGDLDKSRYDEYDDVFAAFVDSVAKLDVLDESVLVITGDIFHHKGKIEPAGIKLAHALLTSLLEHIDVCMICGNHDYRQDNPAIPDMIETIYENYLNNSLHTKHRAFYLDATGYYHYHNIGFAVVDIKDTLKTYNTAGTNDELIAFPARTAFEAHAQIDYAVALFHGTILPSRLANNMHITNGHRLEWFDKYDFVILGDNHRYQWSVDDGKMWGYSGSLIQQDFGETFMEHGYLVWDLETKAVEFNLVYNNYGYCTVKEVKTKLYAMIKKNTSIELCNIVDFPKHVAFRVFSKETIPKVEAFCAANDITPSCIVHWSPTAEKENGTDNANATDTDILNKIEELNTTDKWFEYLANYTDIETIKPFILHPELLKLPMVDDSIDFFKKYTDRNDKIQKVIDEYIGETTKVHKTAKRAELLNMSWSYLMCYGEANFFDFSALHNSIALLNGKNAMGKSSFLDILCIALYGEPTKMRHLVNGRKYTDKIIHDQRPANKVAPFVKLLLKIGDAPYEIYRTFATQSSKGKEHLIMQTNIQIYKINDDGALKTLVVEGSTLVDRWVEANIGSMESILMSIMICQTDLNNFFHLKQDEQKLILDKALRLDTVALFGRILKEAILAHNDILQQIKTAKQTIEKMYPVNYVSKSGELEEGLLVLNETINTKLVWRDDILKNLNRIFNASDIYVNIDFAFDEIQTLYLQTNAKTPISCEDNTLMIVAREKVLAIDEELLAKYADAELIDDDAKDHKKWAGKYAKFLLKEPTCEVKMDWIQKTLTDYDAWVESESESDLETIAKAFDAIETQVFNFVKIEKPAFVPSNRFIDVCTLTETEYTAKCERRKTRLIDPPNKNRSLDEYTHWVAEYKDWSAMVEGVIHLDIEAVCAKRERVRTKLEAFTEATREHTHMAREMAALEDDLSDVKLMDFNPECWACKKNPFAHKKTKLTKRYDDVRIRMDAYKAQLIEDEVLSKWRGTIDDCDKNIEVYAAYTRDKDRYAAEVTYWNDVRKVWKTYDKWKSEVDGLTEAINAFENYRSYTQHKAYKEQEVAHKTLLDAYKTQKARLERAKARAHEASEWERVLVDIEKYKDVYKAYEVWASEHAIITAKLDGLDKSIQKRRLEDLRRTHEAEYMSKKTKVDISERYENAKNMYYSNKLHLVDAELSDLTSKREGLLVEKAKSDASDHVIRTHKTTLDKLLYLEQTYEDRLIKIKHLDVVFMGDKTASDGYKEWIYKSQVIPMINREMNRFLCLFENFAFLMSYDKKHFIYMLEDRGNTPTLDKASGYQNFIIGLAFRIILTRIGCIGQQMKHLFIDEGFTACDAQNIEKVPSMLKSILTYGDYASITLMSHLDSVRECASVHINIERKEPFSYIHYGDAYPTFSIYCEDTGTIVKKTRGRPKSVKK